MGSEAIPCTATADRVCAPSPSPPPPSPPHPPPHLHPPPSPPPTPPPPSPPPPSPRRPPHLPHPLHLAPPFAPPAPAAAVPPPPSPLRPRRRRRPPRLRPTAPAAAVPPASFPPAAPAAAVAPPSFAPLSPPPPSPPPPSPLRPRLRRPPAAFAPPAPPPPPPPHLRLRRSASPLPPTALAPAVSAAAVAPSLATPTLPPPPPALDWAPACCRWTPAAATNQTCSPIEDECTKLHEYLEHKTTTHHFENVVTCLGNDPKNWAVQFDGTTSNVTLSNGPTAVAAVPTPLKVTHATDCAGTAPKLSLQMDTVALGTLMVGGSTSPRHSRTCTRDWEQPHQPPAPPAPTAFSTFRSFRRVLPLDRERGVQPSRRQCTKLHEYLERKTTTHHFENVYSCLGNSMEDWEMQFDGTTSNVTLLNGATAVAAVPTPLKVVHPPRCHFDAPTLYLQEGTYP